MKKFNVDWFVNTQLNSVIQGFTETIKKESPSLMQDEAQWWDAFYDYLANQ